MLKLNDIIKPELVRLSMAAECPLKRKSRILQLSENGIITHREAQDIIVRERL